VNASLRRRLARRKGAIQKRLTPKPGQERPTTVFAASNIRYEIADRVRGIAPGGIGAIHLDVSTSVVGPRYRSAWLSEGTKYR
jgi:hypothetical protein